MRDARPPLGATFFSGSWGASTSPASMGLPCRRRSRPQHQKLTHAPQQIALFDGLVSEREPFVCNLQVERVSDQISGDEAKMNFRISRALPPPGGASAHADGRYRAGPPICRFLAVRKVPGGKWGGLFLGYLLRKKFIGSRVPAISAVHSGTDVTRGCGQLR